MPPFVCFFHFFRSGDSLAAASDPLWVFHENFDPPAPKYTHTMTRRQNATHSHFHTFTEQHSPLVPSSSKRFFFCWLRLLSAHVRSRAESSNNNNNDGDDDGKMAAKFGIQKRFPRCRLASSHCFFFLCSTFSQHLRTKFQKQHNRIFSPQAIIHFFLQFNYLRLSTQNNEKALHRGSQEAKGKLFIFPMLPIFPPLPTAVRETFGRLHASSPNFHTSQYNPLPGAQYSDSLFTHWKR